MTTNGQGTMWYSNGDIYEGNFINGIREGFGKFSCSTGKFEGNFVQGQIEGYGKFWLIQMAKPLLLFMKETSNLESFKAMVFSII